MYEGIWYHVPPTPPTYVERPKEVQALVHALLDLDRETPVAVYSPRAGDGKRTLTAAVCAHAEVQALFNAGIVWLRVGETPDIPALLREVSRLAGEALIQTAQESDEESDPDETLHDNYFLLVLEDVHNPAVIYPLLKLGDQFDHIILTSEEDVLNVTRAQTIPLDKPSEDEAVLMLAAHLPEKPPQSALALLLELGVDVGQWPVLLHLTGKLLRHFVQKGDSIETAISKIDMQLEQHEAYIPEDAVDHEYAQGIKAMLDLALAQIPNSQPYHTLGIFLPHEPIPSTTLAKFWQLDLEKTDALLSQLAAFDLLAYENQAVSLHNALYHSLATHTENANALQHQLIAAWGDAKNLPDAYAWEHFGDFLHKTGQTERLSDLLFDFGWVQALLSHTSAMDVWRDYHWLSHADDVNFIQEALKESARYLNRDASQLPEQLIARLPLGFSDRLDKFIGEAEKSKMGQIWLKPMTGSLKPATDYFPLDFPDALVEWDELPAHIIGAKQKYGGEGQVTADDEYAFLADKDGMIHVWDDPLNSKSGLFGGKSSALFEGHADWISLLEYDPQRQRLASASMDGLIMVWDLKNKAELHTLDEHTDKVSSLHFTAEGRYLVSGSWDETVIVWDLPADDVKHILAPEVGFILAVTVTPDGKKIIAAAENTLLVWDMESGHRLHTWDSAAVRINHLHCTPDNRFLFSAGDEIEVWDLQAEQRIARFGTGTLFPRLSLDSDNRSLLYDGLPMVQLVGV